MPRHEGILVEGPGPAIHTAWGHIHSIHSTYIVVPHATSRRYSRWGARARHMLSTLHTIVCHIHGIVCQAGSMPYIWHLKSARQVCAIYMSSQVCQAGSMPYIWHLKSARQVYAIYMSSQVCQADLRCHIYGILPVLEHMPTTFTRAYAYTSTSCHVTKVFSLRGQAYALKSANLVAPKVRSICAREASTVARSSFTCMRTHIVVWGHIYSGMRTHI